MSSDRYSNFGQLLANEQAWVDYSIISIKRPSKIAILAPHGGLIEPGTSEIAMKIAGEDYSLYLFQGLKKRPHRDLHVTSHKYDEPQALFIVNDSEIVVALHGRADKGDPVTVWVGGLDSENGTIIVRELDLAGFPAKIETEELGATHPRNICNLGRKSAGLQLEIPRSLRKRLQTEPATLTVFSHAVRKALLAAQQDTAIID